MTFTPIILTHLFAALGAVIVGGIALTLKKGTPLHRWFGRIWVTLMLIAVLVSFGIQRSGHFSWIHLLSVGGIFMIGMGLYSIYRRNIHAHRRFMTGTYTGLVIAGIFTLLPWRRLGYLAWHAVGLI